MADAAKIKAAYGNTARGRPGKHLIDSWNREHPDDPYVQGDRGSEVNGHAPDYPADADDFEALFDESAMDGGDDDIPAETPPRRPKAGTRSRSKGIGGFFGKSSKAKPKRKSRVSTEELLGGIWRAGAKLASPLPPLQRTLRIQAPVAGTLLEGVVKDTVIDPWLQPLARLAGAGKTANALLGPPMWVTAISVHVAQRAAMSPPLGPHPMFMAVAEEGLRSGLMAWCEVSGPAFEQALRREREFEEKFGATVDDMMAMIFAPPVNPADADAVQAEEDAIRRAQGIL